jgi:predicted metalloendopeptidase
MRLRNTKKHNSKKHNITRKINTINHEKKCVTDDEIGKICSTGQFSTYKGNFYKNKEHIEKFKEIKAKFLANPKYKKLKTHKERYTAFLKENFQQGEIPKVIKMIKNDYYSYVNEEWFKDNDIEKTKDNEKKFYVQYDNFRIVQEEVYYKLIGYVKNFIKENPKDKKAIALNAVYSSLHNNTKKTMNKHADAILTELDTFVKNEDMYGLLGMINSNEIISLFSPLQWYLTPDEKNVKQYISHLGFGRLGIYDYLIYITDLPEDDAETKKYKKLVKKEYIHYISEVFNACIGLKRAAKYNPHDIWDVELEMLMQIGCDENIKTDPNYYNKISAHELETTYDFDWTTFCKKLGYKNIPKNIVVSNLNGLKCMIRLFKANWNSPKWQTYFLFIQFKQMVRFEESSRHIHYNFHHKFLEGQPNQMPREIYPIFGLSLLFNTFLSEQYIEHNYNSLYVNYVKHLVDDLKELFIKRINANTWLSPVTKKAALDKLHKLTIMVGKPQNLRNDPIFDYKSDDPLFNIGTLIRWKHKKFIELEGKAVIDIPDFDWNVFKLVGTQCYMVNAYYRPNSNSIYVPLAYLQKPFIDLEQRGLEYNLVYIGYTLGHELSHALDDTGSKFDADGNLNNWWTDADRIEFKKKVSDVINQYQTFAARDGIKFDAEMSVGEDLADISGMALVEAYLLDNQIANNELTKIKKMNLAKLYMNLAVQGQQQIYKKAVKAQLKMNPHPLEKYRVNCSLARLELFKEMYGIKKGDGMWWNNDVIW